MSFHVVLREFSSTLQGEIPMSTQSVLSKIVQAAQSTSIYEAALAYQEMGFSVLPLARDHERA
jgi:hypothetical protein